MVLLTEKEREKVLIVKETILDKRYPWLTRWISWRIVLELESWDSWRTPGSSSSNWSIPFPVSRILSSKWRRVNNNFSLLWIWSLILDSMSETSLFTSFRLRKFCSLCCWMKGCVTQFMWEESEERKRTDVSNQSTLLFHNIKGNTLTNIEKHWETKVKTHIKNPSDRLVYKEVA